MPKLEGMHLLARSGHLRFLTVLVVLTLCAGCLRQSHAQANTDGNYYARRNTFGVFSAFSDDSSHILLGVAENRKLLEFGVSYSRRLFLNRNLNWQYNGELLPLVLESDPLSVFVENQTKPTAATFSYNSGPVLFCTPVTTPYSYFDPTTGVTYSGTTTISCHGRRWVFGESISPAGLQLNFLPQRRMQPFLIGHGGYMYSTHAIPLDFAGSFNFTFDIGAGFELYRTKGKSIRTEYRYHHISNNNTANANPGIDNGLFQVTYCFGR
jgi:opacity protein-like surface antigen